MMSKRRIFKRSVIQPFNMERRDEILSTMSRHAASMVALSKKKKGMIKAMNTLISKDRRAMDVIEASLIEDGDKVLVDCYFRMDFPNKKKYVIRMDTGEQIGEEPMVDSDYQQDIEDAMAPEGSVDAELPGRFGQEDEDEALEGGAQETSGSAGSGDPGAG